MFDPKLALALRLCTCVALSGVYVHSIELGASIFYGQDAPRLHVTKVLHPNTATIHTMGTFVSLIQVQAIALSYPCHMAGTRG